MPLAWIEREGFDLPGGRDCFCITDSDHTTSCCMGLGMGMGQGTGLGTGKWICNPLVPVPVPFPCLSVVCPVHSIIYKPIVPSAVPGPIPMQCE